MDFSPVEGGICLFVDAMHSGTSITPGCCQFTVDAREQGVRLMSWISSRTGFYPHPSLHPPPSSIPAESLHQPLPVCCSTGWRADYFPLVFLRLLRKCNLLMSLPRMHFGVNSNGSGVALKKFELSSIILCVFATRLSLATAWRSQLCGEFGRDLFSQSIQQLSEALLLLLCESVPFIFPG